MRFDYKTKGVCSTSITFEVDPDGTVRNVAFTGGCNGNAQGVSALTDGMHIDEVIRRVSNIHCGSKGTSCPDQLSKALRGAKEKLAKA